MFGRRGFGGFDPFDVFGVDLGRMARAADRSLFDEDEDDFDDTDIIEDLLGVCTTDEEDEDADVDVEVLEYEEDTVEIEGDGRGGRSGRQRRPQPKVAVIAGLTGIQGLALARLLGSRKDWKKVYGISRHMPPKGLLKGETVTHLPMDLSSTDAVWQKLQESGIKDATHVFFVAFPGDVTNFDQSAAAMMKDLVEGLESTGNRLRHVYFSEGIKYYGVHLASLVNGGTFKTPYREEPFSHEPHLPPDFYYDFEDYVAQRQKEGAKWSWSTLRPGAIIGFAPRSWMSLLQCLAVYGTMCRELGIPMRFPGTRAGYESVQEVVDVDVVESAAVWTATHRRGRNQAFNVSNGDTFRWCHIWPKIAKEFFGIEAGPLVSMSLTEMMTTPDKKELWNRIIDKYGLKTFPYEEVVEKTWPFGDFMWQINSDNFSDITKLSAAGFHGQHVHTDIMFLRKLRQLGNRSIIPHYPKLDKHAKEDAPATDGLSPTGDKKDDLKHPPQPGLTA